MKNIKYLSLFLGLTAFIGCSEPEDVLKDTNLEPEAELPKLTAGGADFSTYVALGASYTAGYTDGALFKAAQENSFPNILAQQFSNVGGGAFTQPLMNDNIGGLLFGGQPSLDAQGNNRFAPRFYFNGTGPVRLSATSTTDIFVNNPTGPFNNMGVPGAKSFHLLFDGYGNPANLATATANPYFVRMASSPTSTVLGDAMAQNPSFFTLSEIAGNDVLGYALAGGDVTIDQITPQAMFEGAFGALVSTLTSGGAQGAVGNIPYITSLPHFTTVPYAPLSPANPSFGPQIPTLNTIFGALNQVFSAYGETNRLIVFSETAASAVVIKDENLADFSTQITNALAPNPDFAALLGQFGLPPSAAPSVAYLLGQIYGKARQATANDLLVLSSSSVIGTVNTTTYAYLLSLNPPANLAGQFSVEGVTNPLADKWVLLPSEQAEIKTATDAFNVTIKAVTNSAGLAFVDTNIILQQLSSSGYASDNFVLTSSLVTGGAFSLDGVHTTSRGYALIANEFLKAIDATYGSNFEASGNLIDIGDYPTNYSPALR